ncbi:MAG: ATP synthase F1 subunit delta [Fimbriiglobus sp.]
MAETSDVKQASPGTVRVARVYAEALLNVAISSSQQDVIGSELQTAAAAFATNNSSSRFLAGNLISKSEKLPILAKAFEHNSSDTFKKFLGILNENGRLGMIPAISTEYDKLQDKAAGRVRVQVTAAVPLLDAQIEHLKTNLAQQLKGTPILEIVINPEILGGLILQVGDKVYDTSVRARLDNLRTHLTTSGTHG